MTSRLSNNNGVRSQRFGRFCACFALAAAAAGLTGCSSGGGGNVMTLKPSPKSVTFIDMGSDGWRAGEPVTLAPDSTRLLPATGTLSTPTAILRYTARTPLASLPVAIEQESLDGIISCDTVTFRLYRPDGHPEGTGSYSVFEAEIKLPPLRITEGYSITLTPLQDATGIVAAGMRLD